jgi:peroxiredoxin
MREAVKIGAVLAIILSAALIFVRLQENKGYGLKQGEQAPDFTLPALKGGEVHLAGYRGRLVVVNFWATWCPPCVAEMPSLQGLQSALGPDGLVVLSVSADEDKGLLERFVEDHKITFPVLRDPGGRLAASAYRTTGYPETFVVDPSGSLKEIYVGPAEWDTPDALAHFRALLSAPKTSPTR